MDYVFNKRLVGRNRYGLAVTFLVLIAAVSLQSAFGATRVSRSGITWTFDRDYPTGVFANGSYWVVGPVTITSIDPPSIMKSDYNRVVNGSMINPTPVDGDTQGYDSEAYKWHPTSGLVYPGSGAYSEAKNVARRNGAPISAGNALVVPPGSSLVSTISTAVPTRPILQAAAVLTVLDSAPPAGSFRPPYSGTDKTIRFNKSDLNYGVLSNLTPVPSTPSFSSVAGRFDELWLDHVPSWHGRYIHPINSMHDYSRDFARDIGDGAVLLNVRGSTGEKEMLLINMVQLGIDNYRNMQLGASLPYGNWVPIEGQNMGRKLPIVLAGRVLGNDEMLNVGKWKPGIPVGNFNPVFQEDLNMFIVSQSDVDETKTGIHGSAQQYTSAYIGLPEWGSRHYGPYADTRRDDASWSAPYRDICGAGMVGHVLAIHIMGLKREWDNDVFFDYHDRWWAAKNNGVPPVQVVSTFTRDMWLNYRDDYGPVWPEQTTNEAPIADAGVDVIVWDNDDDGVEQVILDASGSSDPDGSITSYVWTENGTQIATGVTAAVFFEVGEHPVVLRVTDNEGATDIDTVAITVAGEDRRPPEIVSVTPYKDSIDLVFDEPLEPGTAENKRNYFAGNIVSVTWASLHPEGNKVTLTTFWNNSDTSYKLAIMNIRDLSGNVMPDTTIEYEYCSGLVGFWQFSEGAGYITEDASGNGNTGTLINGATWNGNGFVTFDGVDDAVEVPIVDLDMDRGTIALWAYARSFGGHQYLFGHCAGTWANRIQLYLNDGSLSLGLGDSHFTVPKILMFQPEVWHHIALTWDRPNYVLYVNGVAIASGTYSGLDQLSTFADIGNNGNILFRDEAFHGIIDDVRLYDRPLASQEVSRLFTDFLYHLNDLRLLVRDWLKTDSPADVAPVPTGDGMVNSLDLAVFARRWQQSPE